jgi:hypothetical protein
MNRENGLAHHIKYGLTRYARVPDSPLLPCARARREYSDLQSHRLPHLRKPSLNQRGRCAPIGGRWAALLFMTTMLDSVEARCYLIAIHPLV